MQPASKSVWGVTTRITLQHQDATLSLHPAHDHTLRASYLLDYGDGSGMLVAAATPGRLSAVGDAFEMEMDREPLGDLPMGRYRTRNVVTRLQPGRLLEWAVGSPDGQLLGHVYGYELVPVSEAETAVTSYCDWSAVIPAIRARMTWPVVPVDRLERSLVNLAALLNDRAR